MRKLIATVAVASLMALMVVATANGATKTVTVDDEFFKPTSVSIQKGDKVTWKWRGEERHNVTGPTFRSTTKTSGTYSRTFRKKGSFRVICTIHPPSMRMTVRVK